MLSLIRHSQPEKNYQNHSFQGQDLSYHDFSDADIRGADFTDANLTGASFRHAKAGLSRRATLQNIVITAALSGFSGVAAVIAVYTALSSILRSLRVEPQLPLTIAIIGFLIIIIANGVLLVLSLRQGLQQAIKNLAIAIAVSLPIMAILAGIGQDTKHPFVSLIRGFRIGHLTSFDTVDNAIAATLIGSVISIGATLTAIFTLALAIGLIKIIDNKILEFLVTIEALAIATITIAIVTKNADDHIFDFFNQPLVNKPPTPEGILTLTTLIIVAIILVIIVILLSHRISQGVLEDHGKNPLIRQFSVSLACLGGTRFVGANLTDTNFSQALLKSTNFSNANTHHTRWYQAEKLEWAKLDNTILEVPKIRQLLVTLDGYRKSYIGANLEGANLMNANLEYANLTEANLSDVTLENANLEWTKLSQTQAIGTNFKEAYLTGACGLGTWNIDSTTNLTWVNCKFIYLLEDPKPGTDDRERRPSSGEFKADEFTKLFQEALDTVDLIFREGVDWRAFIYSFKKVQVQNEDTELKIQRIEDQGDGCFVVRVRVPPETDKAKIHEEFTQNYEETIQALNAKYQGQLDIKESELATFRQSNSNLMEVVRYLASREVIREPKILSKNYVDSGKLVIVKVIQGDFQTGFKIGVQIGKDGMLASTEIAAFLPAFPEIKTTYQQWKLRYTKLKIPQRINVKKIKTSSNDQLCKESAMILEKQLKTWLKSEDFYPVKDRIQQKINTQDDIRLIIQTSDPTLLRLPWHAWDVFEHYPKVEVALSLPEYDRTEPTTATSPKNKVRILAIIGHSEGDIQVQKDKAILENLNSADVTILEKPKRLDLDANLRDELGWDILFFAGHSSTQEESGVIYINPDYSLTVPDLKFSLRFALERGLKLAIFNSCDGLGLARDLADLHIPQMIVMREPVPDQISTKFLKDFLTAFSRGKTLYTAVREAREKLHALEDIYPCASWLPIIFQHPAEVPLMWDDLRGLSTTETHIKPFLEALAKLRDIFEQTPDLSPLEKANVLEQIQALVQVLQMPQSEFKQKLGSKALMVIKGAIADVPATSALKRDSQPLLDKISQAILG